MNICDVFLQKNNINWKLRNPLVILISPQQTLLRKINYFNRGNRIPSIYWPDNNTKLTKYLYTDDCNFTNTFCIMLFYMSFVLWNQSKKPKTSTILCTFMQNPNKTNEISRTESLNYKNFVVIRFHIPSLNRFLFSALFGCRRMCLHLLSGQNVNTIFTYAPCTT